MLDGHTASTGDETTEPGSVRTQPETKRGSAGGQGGGLTGTETAGQKEPGLAVRLRSCLGPGTRESSESHAPPLHRDAPNAPAPSELLGKPLSVCALLLGLGVGGTGRAGGKGGRKVVLGRMVGGLPPSGRAAMGKLGGREARVEGGVEGSVEARGGRRGGPWRAVGLGESQKSSRTSRFLA